VLSGRPRRFQPQVRVMLVLAQVSSMKTSRRGSMRPCTSSTRRRRAISGRPCSLATRFLKLTRPTAGTATACRTIPSSRARQLGQQGTQGQIGLLRQASPQPGSLAIEFADTGRPTHRPRRIGLGLGLLGTLRGDAVQIGQPLQAAPGYIAPVALAGDQRLFYN
jgi:hypothetical protein